MVLLTIRRYVDTSMSCLELAAIAKSIRVYIVLQVLGHGNSYIILVIVVKALATLTHLIANKFYKSFVSKIHNAFNNIKVEDKRLFYIVKWLSHETSMHI